jgi:hypothetical protein
VWKNSTLSIKSNLCNSALTGLKFIHSIIRLFNIRTAIFEAPIRIKQKQTLTIMKMKSVWMSAMFVACACVVFTSCKDDNDSNAGTGTAQFEITDAPVDDASVKSVFVTVADVKVDGQSISGFSKQTIDLKAYQKGTTKILGTTDLAAKTYSHATLVLDLDANESGSAPGCYVLTQDNIKYKLTNANASSGKLEIPLNKDWSVTTGTTSNVVLDFDLRKALAYSDDASVRYRFVNSTNLQSAIRVVAKSNSANIKGTYTEQTASNADAVIVYAYKKGTFDAATETQVQGEDNLTFKNAVSSAKVETALSGNTYTLSFLEAGEYELHFAGYTRDNTTNRFNFKSLLESDVMVNGSVSTSFNLTAGSDLNVSATIKGLLSN